VVHALEASGRGNSLPLHFGQGQDGLVIMRPITGPEELDLFCRLPYELNDELAGDLEAGRRRPEWLWVAMHGDQLVARAGWWAREGDSAPMYLDIFDLDDGDGLDPAEQADRIEAGVQLLTTAMSQVVPAGATQPEYSLFVSAGWRDDAVERRAVENRMTALQRTGAELFVERLRLEWRPTSPVPERGDRLDFRAVGERDELVQLMTEVLDGTLDAHSRDDLTRMSARQVAAEQYDGKLAGYPSPRDWWRVATLRSGEPVGFVIPARNDYNAIIAYIGVLPAHRGSGYIDDILAAGTRILAEQDVPRIRAATDVENVPMARAFARAGYVNFQRQINMRWS
jgi:RimJ/RimL family protein N-acetyltransferase